MAGLEQYPDPRRQRRAKRVASYVLERLEDEEVTSVIARTHRHGVKRYLGAELSEMVLSGLADEGVVAKLTQEPRFWPLVGNNPEPSLLVSRVVVTGIEQPNGTLNRPPIRIRD